MSEPVTIVPTELFMRMAKVIEEALPYFDDDHWCMQGELREVDRAIDAFLKPKKLTVEERVRLLTPDENVRLWEALNRFPGISLQEFRRRWPLCVDEDGKHHKQCRYCGKLDYTTCEGGCTTCGEPHK